MAKKKAKKEERPEVKEYDTKRQPLWVTDPKWDHMIQMNGKGQDGQRAYVYRNRGFVVIANKDWEKDGDLVPGKSIKVDVDSMDALLIGFMKKIYGFDFKIDQQK